MNTKPLDLEENYYKALAATAVGKVSGAQLIIFPQGFLAGTDTGILADADWAGDLYNSYVQRLSQEAGKVYLLMDRFPDGGYHPLVYFDGRLVSDGDFEIDGVKIKAAASWQLMYTAEIPQGVDLFVINDTTPVKAGERYLFKEWAGWLSKTTGRTVCVNLGGWGRTSHPYVYMPAMGYFTPKAGYLTMTMADYNNVAVEFVADKAAPAKGGTRELSLTDLMDKGAPKSRTEPKPDTFVMYSPSQNALIPSNIPQKDYCLDLFNLQTQALAARLENLNMKNAVVALSGGLDSALALLVATNAFDLLELDRAGLKVISMPGFGTSSTTKGLAGKLASSLGYQLEMIDITAACAQALKDIGHDGVTPDVTFENVQARMRTLNALNIANATGGIMIGTGDLSEEALGFSTYGGDQLAGYNVNSSISKTVIRTMLPYVTELENLAPAKEAIEGILNIPVSPELVPHGGEILQKTEEILAPYKLIDFYIYCFVIRKDSPSAMAKRAKGVFGDEFTQEYLDDKAKMFCRRFISGQFKRSCAPEGAILTHARLRGYEKSLPSDSSRSMFMIDLDS